MGVNTANGNKMTTVPLFGWTARGGLPVAFTLVHDSESTHNSELGAKWTHSFDIWGTAQLESSGYMFFVLPDDSQRTFAQNMDGTWAIDPVHRDALAHNTDGSWNVTTKNQIVYHFESLDLSDDLYCKTITDANGNTITLNYGSGNYVTSISDPTGRSITLTYDSNGLATVTDCTATGGSAGRVWTMNYGADYNLKSVSLPALSGDSHTYKWQFTYDGDANLASLTPPRGYATAAPNSYSWTFSYNSDDSIAWIKDPLSNQTSFTYTAGSGHKYCNITDPNGNVTTVTYTSSHVTSVIDPLSQHTDYTWDASNHLTQVNDRRGYA